MAQVVKRWFLRGITGEPAYPGDVPSKVSVARSELSLSTCSSRRPTEHSFCMAWQHLPEICMVLLHFVCRLHPCPAAPPTKLPAQPEPCWGPEAVCMAQLEALAASDAAGVFRFASPTNQAATGPSVERFAEMLQAPQYRPLLQHQGAEVLRSVQMKPDVALLIVGELSSVGGVVDV